MHSCLVDTLLFQSTPTKRLDKDGGSKLGDAQIMSAKNGREGKVNSGKQTNKQTKIVFGRWRSVCAEFMCETGFRYGVAFGSEVERAVQDRLTVCN